MILVSGATGTTGRDIVRQLARVKAPVRAMARNPDKAADLRAPGVEVVRADLADPTSLAPALRGCNTALLLLPPGLDLVPLAAPFIAAAKAAGVKRIVHFSALGAGPAAPSPLVGTHGRIEVLVRELGLAWTILRPNFFMQNLLGSAGTIKAQGTYYSNFGDGRAAFVDTRDIAAVVAHVLAESGHESQTYGITGPEALTGHQVAEVLSRVLGRPITHTALADDAYTQALTSTGIPAPVAKGIAALAGLVRSGEAAKVTGTVEKIGRKKPTTLERFIRDHAGVFRV